MSISYFRPWDDYIPIFNGILVILPFLDFFLLKCKIKLLFSCSADPNLCFFFSEKLQFLWKIRTVGVPKIAVIYCQIWFRVGNEGATKFFREMPFWANITPRVRLKNVKNMPNFPQKWVTFQNFRRLRRRKVGHLSILVTPLWAGHPPVWSLIVIFLNE